MSGGTLTEAAELLLALLRSGPGIADAALTEEQLMRVAIEWRRGEAASFEHLGVIARRALEKCDAEGVDAGALALLYGLRTAGRTGDATRLFAHTPLFQQMLIEVIGEGDNPPPVDEEKLRELLRKFILLADMIREE